MNLILNNRQILDWDLYTIQHEPITSIDLMERAALKCTQWILEHFTTNHNFIVFAGPGNNGGDGLAIARQLLDAGAEVQVLYDKQVNVSQDNQHNYLRLQHTYPHSIRSYHDTLSYNDQSIVIDAMFGTGLHSSLRSPWAERALRINAMNTTTVSIDIPSGLSADTYIDSAVVVNAHYTLSFECFKIAFIFPETGQYCGQIILLPIGLHPHYLNTLSIQSILMDKERALSFYKVRNPFSHKGSHGHTLLACGSRGKIGAAILAANACLRSGTGLVTVLIPTQEYPILAAAVPEAMTIAYDDNHFQIDLTKYEAIALGCGMGTHQLATDIVAQCIQKSTIPLLLDADAITILSLHPSYLDALPAQSLLTPHPIEFDRLFGHHIHSFARHQTAAMQAIERQLFILLKGRYSILYCPNGDQIVNTSGNASLAKGGSGDTLSGIIAALMAQYRDTGTAAALGMYLHGLAADYCASQSGIEAITATDICLALKEVFHQLNLQSYTRLSPHTHTEYS